MNSVKDYTAAINRFGKKLEIMTAEDFPKDTELGVKIDNALVQLQFSILSAFMERGNDIKKG